MKVSSFFKPIARQFAKSTSSSRPKSSAGNIPSGSDKVSVDSRLTGKEAAVRASVLQAGLVSPAMHTFTAKAAAQAASKPTKSAGVKVGVDSKVAGTQKARVASHPTSYASPKQAAINATLAAAHASFDLAATQAAAQRAAKPLSFIGKMRAFFRELGDKNS